jgi:hypothetical protein
MPTIHSGLCLFRKILILIQLCNSLYNPTDNSVNNNFSHSSLIADRIESSSDESSDEGEDEEDEYHDPDEGYSEYKCFHKNQIITAQKIIELFKEYNYIQLQAQMQSGKTGCSIWLLANLLEQEEIKSYKIISGMSDLDLHRQWKTKLEDSLNEYQSTNIDDKQIKLILGNSRIHLDDKVLFSKNLKKIKKIEDFENNLIIIDEIHYGQDAYSLIHKTFIKLGISSILQGYKCLDKDGNDLLKKYNIKILTVTATNATQDAIYNNNPEAKKNWGRVYMEPGEEYKSIFDYNNTNLIKESIKLEKKNKTEIKKILDKYKEQKKYMIIRAAKSQYTYITKLLQEEHISCQLYDQEHTDSFDNKEPNNFTCILIKDKLRLGKELEKKYICAVYESSEKINRDTLLQSLFGRICGYNIKNDIDVYLPNTPEEIEEILTEYELINKDIADAGMTNTSKVSKRLIKPKTTNEGHTFTIPQIIKLKEDSEENYSEKDFESLNDFSNSDKLDIINKVDTSQFSIKQQEEINKFKENTDISKITSIRSSHNVKMKKQYIECWDKIEKCIKKKTQFSLFDQQNITIIIIKADIPNTSFKKYNLIIIFKLNSPNEIIENAFPPPKKPTMHNPSKSLVPNEPLVPIGSFAPSIGNSVVLAASINLPTNTQLISQEINLPTNTQLISQDNCNLYKEDFCKFTDYIKDLINKSNDSPIILRNINDKDKKTKSCDFKGIILAGKTTKDLETKINNVTRISSVKILRKNGNSNGLFGCKEITITYEK